MNSTISVAFGSLQVLAAGLVHHAEAVVAVVDLGKLDHEIAGGLLGLAVR